MHQDVAHENSLFWNFFTDSPTRVPTFRINVQSEEVISSAESQSFPGLFALPKSSQNPLISFHSIQGIRIPRL